MRAGLAVTLLAAGCGEEQAPEPAWALVLEDAPASFLSCWAAGPDDVTFVGTGGTIRHWDGESLRSRSSGTAAWLWWVWGCAPDDAWVVGENGTVLRARGGDIDPVDSGTEATLWGVWGPSCADVWAVGGDPLGPETDIVLRDTGAGFVPAGPEALGLSLFKVWGSGPEDVFVVGDGGVAWRWNGNEWTLQETGCATRLFTVHGGRPADVLAVGGTCSRRFDGASWGPLPGIDLGGRLPNGVFVDDDGKAAIVGFGALKARREIDGSWVDESAIDPIGVDFHAVCGDGRGGYFAVGGNFVTPGSEQRGVIAHWGADHPAFASSAAVVCCGVPDRRRCRRDPARRPPRRAGPRPARSHLGTGRITSRLPGGIWPV